MEKDQSLVRPLLEAEYSLPEPDIATICTRKKESNRCWRYIHIWSWALQFVVFSTSLWVFALHSGSLCSQNSSCKEQQSIYSPALTAVNDDYQTIRFNGSFRAYSPYKGPLSPSVDAAWEDLIELGLFSISHRTLEKIEAPENSAKWPPESGGGYLAQLEVTHQLHCLNSLWRHTYLSEYSTVEYETGNQSSLARVHLDHCADILRQKLMCDADVGVVTYNWVSHMSHPTPNFSTLHKCRDFDSVAKWAKAHRAPVPNAGRVLRMPGSVDLDDLP